MIDDRSRGNKMGGMCANCFTDYGNEFLVKNYPEAMGIKLYKAGKCTSCVTGNIYTIDTFILPAIVELNKKGWITKFCCSGHLNEDFLTTYIYFEHKPKNAPEFMFSDGGVFRLKTVLLKSDGEEGYQELKEINDKIYRWAKNLEPRQSANKKEAV